MSRALPLAAFAAGLVIGFPLGWSTIDARSPRSESPRSSGPRQETPPANLDEEPAEVEELRSLDERLAAVPAQTPSWDRLFPPDHSASSILQRLEDVDSPLDGPNLPHGGRLLDVDCRRQPCIFQLFVPGSGSPPPAPDDIAIHDVWSQSADVREAFEDWMDLRGSIETNYTSYSYEGDRIIPLWWVPEGLDSDEREAITEDIRVRIDRYPRGWPP